MIQNFAIGDLMIDCADAERACAFYANLMDWEKTVAFDCPAVKTDNGMTILFAETDIPYVPPVWPEESGKQQKQMHLDFTVNDLPSAVNEAIRLGATKAAEQYNEGHCVTMLDTEGHPFCLGQWQGNLEYYEKKGYGVIPNISINIDCQKQKTLRNFYAQLTNWDKDFHPAALISDNKMIVCYQGCDKDATMDKYIPPVWPEEPGKQQKQMHFIHQVDDLRFAMDKAICLGATKAAKQYGSGHFVAMLDTEGHPFCLYARI